MKTEDGGPAFPRAAFVHDDPDCERGDLRDSGEEGMSLRDYFAAKAMAALLAAMSTNPTYMEAMLQQAAEMKADGPAAVSWNAYLFADAMLAARKTA